MTTYVLIPDSLTTLELGVRGKPLIADPPPQRIRGGAGHLAGTYPDGVTKIEGTPGPATIRVLHRSSDGWADGIIVAEVTSGADGTWRVDGLDPARRFDVVCRHDGYNDMILSNVAPVIG